MSIKNQKSQIRNCLFLTCLILNGCITDFIPTGIEEVADILVVEGIITDDETRITLNWSVHLTGNDDNRNSVNYVDNARVFVECDDGTQTVAEPDVSDGQYLIRTGQLNLERKYRLRIEIDAHEYCSDYTNPIKTPEIDSVFWIKNGRGHPVKILVATHSTEHQILYYTWSYREDWEYHANTNLYGMYYYDVWYEGYPYYCWDFTYSKELLLGSVEKTVFGKLTDVIAEISPWSKKLSVLYRIDVEQNAISKKAYDYFANIVKNSQQIGSIFAPIPSELRGNIHCITDPERPVIGYMDVSTTTKKRQYINRSEGAYEFPGYEPGCSLVESDVLIWLFGNNPFPPSGWVWYHVNSYFVNQYIQIKCVDCTLSGGTEQKPYDWPN